MRKLGIVLISALLLAAIVIAFGCSDEETTPAPTPTLPSAQLSTVELSEPYLLPKGVVTRELEIYVDGTLWQRVERLSDFGPNDKVYVVVDDSSGQSSIRFGDGEHGARLPTRSSKVVANYRIGKDTDGDGSN